jgi:predicted histidine transporter YuiF (NhaC family)
VEKNNELLKKKQKWAEKGMVVSVVLLFALIVANIFMKENLSVKLGFVIEYIFIGGMGASIGLWYRWQPMLVSNDKLQKNSYENTDERLLMIKRKTDEVTANITLGTLVIAFIFVVSFNSVAANTLIFTALFGVVIYMLLKIFYGFKM